MNYLVIGAGGTGGCLGGYLAAGGKNVTLIARGAHLAGLRAHGLLLHGTPEGTRTLTNITAQTAEEYSDKADVIFLCVKGYSLDGILPLLKKAARPDTIIIPILNLVGTGGRLAAQLPGLTVLDGCVYVAAYISAPGEVTQTGSVLRVICGEREGNKNAAKLAEISAELRACGIDVVISDNIRRDAFRKFMFVSPFAAAGTYHHCTATELQATGAPRDTFVTLVQELAALAAAQGFVYEIDVAQDSIERMSAMGAGATSSMQKDVEKGGDSEVDGLVYEPVRLGKALGVPTPAYAKIADAMGAGDAGKR